MARNNVTRVKINGMEQLLIDLKPKRNEGDVFLKTPVDVTNLVEYINKAKKDGKDYTKGQDLFPVVTNGTANLICDNNEKRTVPSGTSFRYEGEIEDFYHGTFVENGEIRNAWVPKNASERVMPSSFAKMDDLY